MMDQRDDGGPAFPNDMIPHHLQGGMSLREYAAIKLCVPDSGIAWLDDMIRQSQRDRFAGQPDITGSTMMISKEQGEALAGPRPDDPLDSYRWQCMVMASLRYIAADAMIAARKGGAA